MSGVFKLTKDTDIEQAKKDSSYHEPNQPLPSTSSSQQEDKKPTTVVLTGPLSHVYTKALNIAYAKEDIFTDGSIELLQEKDNIIPDIYVYCTDNTEVDKDFIMSTGTINVALDKNPSATIVAIESVSDNTRRSLMLEEYITSRGGYVYSNRDQAIKAVLEALKDTKKYTDSMKAKAKELKDKAIDKAKDIKDKVAGKTKDIAKATKDSIVNNVSKAKDAVVDRVKDKLSGKSSSEKDYFDKHIGNKSHTTDER